MSWAHVTNAACRLGIASSSRTLCRPSTWGSPDVTPDPNVPVRSGPTPDTISLDVLGLMELETWRLLSAGITT